VNGKQTVILNLDRTGRGTAGIAWDCWFKNVILSTNGEGCSLGSCDNYIGGGIVVEGVVGLVVGIQRREGAIEEGFFK
jgi:hypothetical protein